MEDILKDHKPLPPIVFPVRAHLGMVLDKENRLIARAVENAETIAEALNNMEEAKRYGWLTQKCDWVSFHLKGRPGLPVMQVEHSYSGADLKHGGMSKQIDRYRQIKEG